MMTTAADIRNMTPADFRGMRVLVIGAGRSGLGAAGLLVRAGARVTVNDRAGKAGAEIKALEDSGVRFVFGAHPRELFEEAQLIVLSPGVPLNMPELAAFRDRVIGELEFSSLFLGAPVVAITGTNGKSTVTHLVHAMGMADGKDTLLCGNVGDAVSRVLWQRGAGGEGPVSEADLAVIEISSFQLETIVRFRPRVSLILNLSPDHMDRYASMDEYREAKERIFENQSEGDVTVLNADDPVVSSMQGRTRAATWWFSRRGPVSPGTFLDGEGNLVWSGPGGEQALLCGSGELLIRGVHNQENALAAAAAAIAAGVRPASVTQALREFRGLPHRMEVVGNRGGVVYVNDSKGTNVGAVVRSLESVEGSVLLIAGGRDKHGDFTGLCDLVREKVSHLILIGEAAGTIERSIGSAAGTCHNAGTLREAVRYAAEQAQPGNTVLLSPGCASFDQFVDFEDRGRQFREAVEALDHA